MESEARQANSNSTARANSVDIRPAATEDELRQIFRLRYNIYVEEQGKHQAWADHGNCFLQEPADESALHLSAFSGTELVASVRRIYSDRANFDVDHESLFSISALRNYRDGLIGYSSRFVVRTDFRRTRTAIQLTSEAFRLGLEKSLNFDFLLAHPGFVPLYESLAYRRIGKTHFDRASGVLFPMLLLVRDFNYLNEIRSPWIPIARHHECDLEVEPWYRRHFPVLTDCRRSIDCPAPLERADLAILWQLGFVHEHQAGEQIQREGSLCHAVGIVISGHAEGINQKLPAGMQFFGSHDALKPGKATTTIVVADRTTILWVPWERMGRLKGSSAAIEFVRHRTALPQERYPQEYLQR